MDKISELLQEAKPLYLRRKKRRNTIKGVLGTLAVAFVCFYFLPQNMYVKDNGQWVNYEQYISHTSPIEEMGLPVDEYGLLMVS